jgi:hypothetical protein
MVSFRSVAPILPTSDLDRLQEHYGRLGFAVRVHAGGYATASRDGINLHFRCPPSGEAVPPGGAIYLGVDDAQALHAEWTAAGVGELGPLWDPGFGVSEAVHTDPDGNLLRFGSPLPDRPRP